MLKRIFNQKKFIISFGLLLPFYLSSQNLPNIIPPSPKTQELNKYIDFPVDYSTGIPEISIPLYVIKTKGIEIPISLNYHASGIKSGQDDGDVGIGWSLSSNYRVSRTIYGRPDSKDIEMPSNFETVIQNYTNNILPAHLLLPGEFNTPQMRAALQTYFERDKYLSKFANLHDPDMNMPPGGGPNLDGEFDHFNYSIPGQGGTFIIRDRVNKKIAEFNPSNNKFNYLDGVASNNLTKGIIGFSIKDDNQNVYSFGEQVDKSGLKVLETIDNYYQKTVATAWAITDIDTKYGEKVKFSYNTRSVTSKYQMQTSITVKNCAGVQPLFPEPDPREVWQADVNSEFSNSSYDVFFLSNIVTPDERIEFVESSNPHFPNMISEINIYDVFDDSLLKKIQFFYGKEFYYPHSSTFLDSCKVFGKGLEGTQVYKFNYYNRNINSSTILVPDQWGYNNLAPNAFLLHNQFKTDPMGLMGSTCNVTVTNNLGGQMAGYYMDRMVNPNPEIFSLKSVIYPAGGKTVYQYEANQINHSTNVLRDGGGIRIKSITHLDGDVEKLKRDYKYGSDELGGGGCDYYVDHTDFRKENVFFHAEHPATGKMRARRIVNYSSNMFGDPANVDGRVKYNYVTEYISGTGSSGVKNGRTIYKYNISNLVSSRNPYSVDIFNDHESIMKYQGAPRFISGYYYWRKPLLIEKLVYSNSNILLENEIYTYQDKPYPTYKGFKVRPFAQAEAPFDQYLPHYYLDIGSFYNYGVYTIETGLSLLWKKEKHVYFGSGANSTFTTLTYNGLNQVIKETTTNSKNQVIETHTLHPTDKLWIPVFSDMVQANDINQIIEQAVFKNDILISQISYDYSEIAGGIFVPANVKRLNRATGELEDEIIYHRHDSKGNILKVSKNNDVITSYIWSFEKRLPIAQIKGASYESVQSILGSVALEEFSIKARPSKNEIDNFLSPLRTAIASGSVPKTELSSFGYDPLRGMTFQTDGNGRTTSYEYDAFGSLSLVRDQEGKVLKKYDYKYEGQAASTDMGCINTLPNWVNVGSPYCETANNANTGKQLQNQIDNNPCSYTYNKTKTVASINSPACPVTIYAKLFYEDFYSYPTDSGADVVVRFYSDADCLIPVSVIDLQVNHNVERFDGVGNFSNDYSVVVNGTYIVLEYAAVLTAYYPIGTLTWSQDHILRTGNYIIVL